MAASDSAQYEGLINETSPRAVYVVTVLALIRDRGKT